MATLVYPKRLIMALRSDLDGLDDGLAAFAVMSAWEDLARRTNCWQEQASFTLENIPDYLPIAPSAPNAMINLVMWVDVDGWPVYFWASNKPMSTEHHGRVIDTGDTKAIKTADVTGSTLNYTISLRPMLSTYTEYDIRAELPQDLQDYYYQHILHGALSVLCDMSSKPWYNPNKAESSRRRFLGLVGNAKTRTLRRNGYGIAPSVMFNNVALRRKRR